MGQLIHGEAWITHQVPKTVAIAGAWLQNRMEDVIPDVIDRGIEPFVKPFMVALSDDHFELDISRARKLLNWRPRHTLRETLPKIINHLSIVRGHGTNATKFLCHGGWRILRIAPIRARR